MAFIGKHEQFGSQTALQRLIAKFAGPGGHVAIERSGSDYWLHQFAYAQRVISMQFRAFTEAGYSTHSLNLMQERAPVVFRDQNHASLSYTGTWLQDLVNATAYGGTYARSDEVGAKVTFTTPANTTLVGHRAFSYSNAGISLVIIDGDRTLATLLPTAQQLVDQGVVANTCLVANGGTLNPTDRCWDRYQTPVDGQLGNVVFASDLAPGVHVVEVICTAYKNNASTNARIYSDAVFYTTSDMTLATATNTVRLSDLSGVSSVWEYAFQIVPQGGTLVNWVGNSHGYDNETAITYSVDGTPVTPADWQMVAGAALTIRRTSQFHSRDTGAAYANVITDYALSATTGLDIDFTVTFLSNATAKVSGYPAMQPLGTLFDKGSNTAGTSDVVLTLDNDGFVANLRGDAVYLWDADGYYGAMMSCDNLLEAVNYWTSSGTLFHTIQDRSDGLHKVYLTRVSGVDEAITAGAVWRSSTNRRIKYFSGGANASLARA